MPLMHRVQRFNVRDAHLVKKSGPGAAGRAGRPDQLPTDPAIMGFYINNSGNSVTDGHFDGNYAANGTVSIYMTNAAGWYTDRTSAGMPSQSSHRRRHPGDGVHNAARCAVVALCIVVLQGVPR